MERKALFLLLLLVCSLSYSQDMDTIYYDADFKGVQQKAFAKYVRYISYSNDTTIYSNKFITYYITGELKSEGDFTTIDYLDDNKSVFNSYKSYYKNGNIELDHNVVNGKGSITSYFENGLIHQKCSYVDGMMNGIYYEFSEDGNSCIQVEMENDKPKKHYYTYSTKDGFVTKYKIKDNTVYREIPRANELKQYVHNNVWHYYIKNGISLMVNGSIKRDYGKYFTIYVIITNNSATPIEFNPNVATAKRLRKGETSPLKVLTSDEYMSKVAYKQNWSMFFNALGEGLAAQNAGYSVSNTNINANSSTSYVGGSAYANSRGNVGVSTYGGNVKSNTNVTSTTVSYNGAAAYQAQLIASERCAEYNNAMYNERQIREEGYLKRTTINPGETVSGYLNIEYKKADEVSINLNIDTIIYPFIWSVDN